LLFRLRFWLSYCGLGLSFRLRCLFGLAFGPATQSIVLSHGFAPSSLLALKTGVCSVDVALSTVSSSINPLLRLYTSSLLPFASLSRFMLSVQGLFL